MKVLTVLLFIGLAVLCGSFGYLLYLTFHKTDDKPKSGHVATEKQKDSVSQKTSGTVVPEVAPAAGKKPPVVLPPVGDDEGENGVRQWDAAKNQYLFFLYNRSFTARLIQADDETKTYYSVLKNEILSYGKIGSRISWKHELFRVSREPIIRMKFRGKTLCLYFALTPADYALTKYKVEDASDAAMNAELPCLYRISNDRRCAYAKDLIAAVMAKYGQTKMKTLDTDYVAHYPYEANEPLIARGLIKLVSQSDAQSGSESVPPVSEPQADEEELSAAMASPDPNLADIDYVDEGDTDFVPTADTPGVEVIGIVWPEKRKNNKIYRYDPNGETISAGDIVLVPSFDAVHGKEVVRKVAVAKGNYREDPEKLPKTLKKLISVVTRKS